jgi:hypothetical protein
MTSLIGLSRSDIQSAAVSKGVHKCLDLLDGSRSGSEGKAKKKRPRQRSAESVQAAPKRKNSSPKGKQKSLDSFLPPLKKKSVASRSDDKVIIL